MTADIRNRIKSLIGEMSRGAFEREEAIALSLLSAFAGESIFLLGLPGVGKSMIARRLKSAFKDSTCFEYLMSRFSTPDEIFGPVSISKLKDGDTYERCIEGYLPTADVIFLDEIWKAGPAIQNSLLTALNEKIFHNGKTDIQLPLKGIIAASNELPAEDEGLEALWDRFLIRYIVQPIGKKEAFMRLIGENPEKFVMPYELPITSKEYKDIQPEISKVSVPGIIMESLYDLRCLYAKRFANKDESEDDNEIGCPYISDRRWKKIVGILRTSAYLNGRMTVDYSDCLLLEHMLWDKDTQLPMVMKDVSELVAGGVARQHQLARRKGMELEESMSIKDSCYTISAGREDLLISIEDYEKLEGGTPAYGRFTDGNRIAVNFDAGDFRLKCDRTGTLTINSFTYQLRKKGVHNPSNLSDYTGVPTSVSELIVDNIFLRDGIDNYPYLSTSVNKYKSLHK